MSFHFKAKTMHIPYLYIGMYLLYCTVNILLCVYSYTTIFLNITNKNKHVEMMNLCVLTNLHVCGRVACLKVGQNTVAYSSPSKSMCKRKGRH